MTWQTPETEEAWEECLSAYIDDEMSSDDKAELENILKSNTKLATQLEGLKKTSILLRKWNIEAPVPDADFIRDARKQYNPTRRSRLFVRWSVWPLAASAVLVFFLVVFWHGGSPGDISWADVLAQLEQVHTMTGISDYDLSMEDGKRHSVRSKFYFKDPGLSRTETYVQKSDLPYANPGSESVVITRRTPGKLETLTLQTEEGGGYLTLGSKSLDAAADIWMRLKSIAANNANYIGNRVIDGKSVAGFETKIQIPDSPDAANGAVMNGVIKVWASRDDAVPLYLESEWDFEGQTQHMECSDIQWNIPLEDNLFDLTEPGGWDLRGTRIKTETTEITDTGFAPGVKLMIGMGPNGQESLISTGDVTGVRAVSEQVTYLGLKMTQPPATTRITIDLNPEAARTLHDYADAHPDEIIIVNFNGQIKVAGRWVEAMYPAAYSTQLDFDISLIDLSLSELEAKYFAPSNERNNQ